MDCLDVRELLSAYLDDELPSEIRIGLEEHLESCGECSGELARFEKLSAVARSLETPTPPAYIWTQLERKLDEKHDEEETETVHAPNDEPRWLLPIPRLLALAATIVVAVGAGWFGYSTWFGHGDHDKMTADFGRYLTEFHRDPAAAQQFLLTKYEGQAVDSQQAAQRVGYRPAVADGLPEDYAVESTFVMKMPCCTCVHCLCKRPDGGMIAILEHDEETRQWFGDRPEMSVMCNGKQCRVVELDDGIAASWQQDDRHITVIGARDLAEVNQLIAWFDERKQAKLLP
jgi:anti-sigma factor RsiW